MLGTAIPIRGEFLVLFGATLISHFFSPTLFKALSITSILLFGATQVYLLIDAISPIPESQRVEAIIRVVKAFSLLTIVVEGWRGAMFAAKRTSPGQKSYLNWASGGIIACFLCSFAILISMLPGSNAFFQPLLSETNGLASLSLTIVINCIAIFPLLFFAIGNWIIYRNRALEESYLQAICSDYLWYVNLPAIVGSFALFVFSSLLYSMNLPVADVKLIVSGGMTFLIFVAILVGSRIEFSHQAEAQGPSSGGDAPVPEPDKGGPGPGVAQTPQYGQDVSVQTGAAA